MIRAVVVAVCGLAIGICAAKGDSVDVAYRYVEAGGDTSVFLDGVYHSGPPAGILTVITANPSGPIASQISPIAWVSCAGELSQKVSFAWTTYEVNLLADIVGQTKADLIRQLWGQHYDYLWNSQTPIFHGDGYTGYWPGEPAPTAANTNALSLVFALWEIMHDFDGTLASLDLSAGHFRMSPAADSNPPTYANVQAWLGALVLPPDYHGPMPILVHMANPNQQDLISEIPIPEPATVMLVAAATLLLPRRTR